MAVLTYLRCIIESIDHVELLHVTLQYLLALPEKHEEDIVPVRPTALARRRKSSMLITNLAQGQEKPLPDLFTLVDLVLTSLRSRNQQTVTATLQLVSVILRTQHQYAMQSFVKTRESNDIFPTRTISVHHRITATLFSMAEDLIEHDDLAEDYEAHLQDARTLVESHCCSSQLLALPGPTTWKHSIQAQELLQSKTSRVRLLNADDPLLASLMYLLQHFLANDISTNLSLTQTISALASCGSTSLDGWLLNSVFHGSPSNQNIATDVISDHDDTITLKNVNRSEEAAAVPPMLENPETTIDTPNETSHRDSVVFTSLDSLINKVDNFRHSIQEFDVFLAERRHVFKLGEDIDKAVANDVPLMQSSGEGSSAGSARVSNSRYRRMRQIGSISERMMFDTSSSEVSRSSSPRGRQPSDSPSLRLGGRSNNNPLRVSPSPSPSTQVSRTFSPSPLQKDILTPTPPQVTSTLTGPGDFLRQKIKININSTPDRHYERDIGSETSSMRSDSTTAEATKVETEAREITLSHLLTNVIILQEFILELAAIIEIRASLFGEVKFA